MSGPWKCPLLMSDESYLVFLSYNEVKSESLQTSVRLEKILLIQSDQIKCFLLVYYRNEGKQAISSLTGRQLCSLLSPGSSGRMNNFQSHIIAGSQRLEGTLRDHLFQPPCESRFPTIGHTGRHPDSSWIFLQKKRNLFQRSVTLTVKCTHHFCTS